MPTCTRSPKLKQNEGPTHKLVVPPTRRIPGKTCLQKFWKTPATHGTATHFSLPLRKIHRISLRSKRVGTFRLTTAPLFSNSGSKRRCVFRGRHGWPLVHRSSTKTLTSCSRQQQRLRPKKQGHCACGRSGLAEDSTNNIGVVLVPKATNQAQVSSVRQPQSLRSV